MTRGWQPASGLSLFPNRGIGIFQDKRMIDAGTPMHAALLLIHKTGKNTRYY
jgi:hypothetical protein